MRRNPSRQASTKTKEVPSHQSEEEDEIVKKPKSKAKPKATNGIAKAQKRKTDDVENEATVNVENISKKVAKKSPKEEEATIKEKAKKPSAKAKLTPKENGESNEENVAVKKPVKRKVASKKEELSESPPKITKKDTILEPTEEPIIDKNDDVIDNEEIAEKDDAKEKLPTKSKITKKKANTKEVKSIFDSVDEATEEVTNKIIEKETDKLSDEVKDVSHQSKMGNLKICSWNIAGLRAWCKKDGFKYIVTESPDIVCLQELKCGTEKEIPQSIKLEGYYAYWNLQKGLNGIGLLSKVKPISVKNGIGNEEFDKEKRSITAEFKDFILVTTYVVNAGNGLKTLDKRLQWNTIFEKYISELDKEKPVVIAGDMNVAHQEIDLANPKANMRHAGFTIEERDGMTNLLSLGFADVYRHFYPDTKDAYTFWTYLKHARDRNVGWRLDYFIVSNRFLNKVVDTLIHSKELGSDHCPIVLHLDLEKNPDE